VGIKKHSKYGMLGGDIMSDKETRVLQPQDTPNYENRNIDKSNAPARPAPMPKTKK
jgi:hypothetical protein